MELRTYSDELTYAVRRGALAAGLVLAAGACGGSDGPSGGSPDAGRPDAVASADAQAHDAATADGGRPDASSLPDAGGGDPLEGTIGATGGVIRAGDDSVVFTVPAGALAEDVTIRIEVVGGPASAVGTVVDLSPDGLQFAVPAKLELSYDEARLPAGFTEDDVVAAYLEEGAWVATAPTTVDAGGNRAVADVSHFSVVGLTVLVGQPIRLDFASQLGDRLENIVLDSDKPDYIVAATNAPIPLFQGIIAREVLTIEPGVRIWFEEDTGFRIPPTTRLVAKGTEAAPIIFEGSKEGGASPSAGHWRGLLFNSQRVNDIQTRNLLEHVIVRHAGRAYTEQNARSTIATSVGVGSHDPSAGNIVDLHVRNSLIEEGLGSGIDIITDMSFEPGMFLVEGTTIRAIESFPMTLWPYAAEGVAEDNVYESVGDERLWIRSGEVVNYEVSNKGIPLLYGMTQQEVDDYPGFTPPKNLQVWREMLVEAGAILEFKSNADIVLINDGDTSSLAVNGTQGLRAIFRPDKDADRWGGISIRSGDRGTVLRYVDILSARNGIDIGFGNDNAFARLDNVFFQNCTCGVFRFNETSVVEKVDVVYDNTPTEDCGF